MYRPSYHFLPEKNWMNDPNGVCWYGGKYHLFYQYNPTGDEWGNLHWGHAVSEDCVRWEHLPAALYPSREEGEVHCFSGSASVDGALPLLYYTSVGEGERDSACGAQQWYAYSEDGMLTWKKGKENPLLTGEIHRDMEVLEWRDPFVWKEEDGWYMVLGGLSEGRGVVLLYHSCDQKHWEFLHVLMRNACEGEGTWECPNYFKLGDKAVLVYSPGSRGGMPCYFLGTEEEGHHFLPSEEGVIDHAGWEGFYAPNSFVDNRGRRIMLGWMPENARGDLVVPGWKGVQSLPRELFLKDGRLGMRPLPELVSLRGEREEVVDLAPGTCWQAGTAGKALEILAEFDTEQVNGVLEIDVFASEDRRERTTVRYDRQEDTIFVDREKSNAEGLTSRKLLDCGRLGRPGHIRLQIFLDYSTLEVFINEGSVISARVYPSGKDSDNVFVCGAQARISKLEIYKMNSIW